VQQLRLQQLRLKTDLRSKPGKKADADELPLKSNAARLEVMDRLSLHFCMNPEQGLLLEAYRSTIKARRRIWICTRMARGW